MIFYILTFFSIFLSSCNFEKEGILLNGYVEGEFRFLSTVDSGIVSKIQVNKGDWVKKDQVLVLIENTDLQLKLIQAQSAFDLSKITLDRYIVLAKQNAISQADLDNAQTNFEKAKADLDLAKWYLGKDTLIAPEEGYIQDVLKYTGEAVNPQSPVIYFLPKSGIKVRFFIPQSLLSKIKIGQKMNIMIDGVKNKLTAQIQYISEKVEYNPPMLYTNQLRDKLLFMVEAVPENLDFLKPGQPLTVEILND